MTGQGQRRTSPLGPSRHMMGAPSCLAKTLRLCPPQPRAPCSWEQPSTGLPDSAVRTARGTNGESVSPVNPLASHWRAAGPDSSAPTRSIHVLTQSQPVLRAPHRQDYLPQGPLLSPLPCLHPPPLPGGSDALGAHHGGHQCPQSTRSTFHITPQSSQSSSPPPHCRPLRSQPTPRTRVTPARRAGGRAAQGRSQLKGAWAAIRAQNPRVMVGRAPLLPGPPPPPRGAMRSTARPARPRAGSAPYLRDVVHALLESVQDDLLQHRHGLLAGRQRAGEQGLLGACVEIAGRGYPACARPSPRRGFGGAITKAPQPGRHSLPGLQG